MKEAETETEQELALRLFKINYLENVAGTCMTKRLSEIPSKLSVSLL